MVVVYRDDGGCPLFKSKSREIASSVGFAPGREGDTQRRPPPYRTPSSFSSCFPFSSSPLFRRWFSSSLSNSLSRECMWLCLGTSTFGASSSARPPFRRLRDRELTGALLAPARLYQYRHEWTKVVIGVWQKYPNPSAAHVTCVDTIDRSVDPETGIIRTYVQGSDIIRTAHSKIETHLAGEMIMLTLLGLSDVFQ